MLYEGLSKGYAEYINKLSDCFVHINSWIKIPFYQFEDSNYLPTRI